MLKSFIYLLLAFIVSGHSYVKAQALPENIPPVNTEIIAFVNSVLKKRVDRGECWDLANKALTKAGAKWDHKFVYGKLIDPVKEEVFPGDIIQFYGVKMKYDKDNQTFSETMKQHTAIVYKVRAPGVYEIAHQNTGGPSGKKVSIGELDLKNVIKGKMKFYRPVKDSINKGI